MMGFKKLSLVILSVIFGIVRPQLAQYGSSSGSDTPLGTVGALPVGIGSGGSKQGSGGSKQGTGGSKQGRGGSKQGNGGSNGGFRGDLAAAIGNNGGVGGGDHQGLDWLREALPGEPEIDYPIYSLPPPASSFSCDNRVILSATRF